MRPLQTEIESVFSAAQNCAKEDRERVISELCKDNDELRNEIQSLLAASDKAQCFLEDPPFLSNASTPETPLLANTVFKPGESLGAYELLEEIGRGGMGVVYRAKRSDGEYDKQVAIKLLRLDFGGRNWDERFAIEKQILASLNHPNIAQLIDGGTTEDGQSYLVMELVQGEPVDVYCERHQLSISERLSLFKKICEAVNVAHSNLVVHRDLKPDNIIVMDNGEPKLLDFGVAKLLSSDVNLTLGITNAVPFTPEYAAPEQLSGGNITTATDIYALGVLLWELLCKNRPYSGITSIAELIRTITEEEFPVPSKHATGALRHSLHGDLDSITRKALSLLPADRYLSVNDLIADIDNFLSNRPVVANHQGALYKAVKFLKRNALATSVAVLFAVVLVAGSLTSLWQRQIALTERDVSEERYGELRKVVRAMVFDLPERIVNYPGSEAVRADMTEQGVELLDLLHKQEPEDPSLLLELAKAYYAMARLQRGPGQADLGQTKLAISSHNKSVELLNRLVSVKAGDVGAIQLLSSNYMSLTYLYYAFDFQIDASLEAGELCDEITQQWPSDITSVFIDARVSCLLAISFIQVDQGFSEEAANHLDEVEKLLNLEPIEGDAIPKARHIMLTSRLNEERAKLASVQGNEHLAIDLDMKRMELYHLMPSQQEKHKRRLIAWANHQLGRRHSKVGEFELAGNYFDNSMSGWSEIYERNNKDIPAIQNIAMLHADKARLIWQQAEAVGTESSRADACAQYALSTEMLERLDNPMARFPTRHRDMPTPKDIFTEAAQRCGA